jgi:multidrug transporter EmrE-like cation transporter
MLKGIVAGAVNLGLALATGAHLPSIGPLFGAGIVGFLGYGVSLVMFALALRHLGTARTGAYFSMAPFIGAGLAIIMFGEPITAQLLATLALMSIGVALHLMEGHEHRHTHEPLEHEHRHTHDAHHRHGHGPGEPHVHVHQHAVLTHSHPHYPDLHHRHEHAH